MHVVIHARLFFARAIAALIFPLMAGCATYVPLQRDVVHAKLRLRMATVGAVLGDGDPLFEAVANLLETRKVIASFDVAKDPDVPSFDPGLKYLYVAGESGIVSLFNIEVAEVTKRGGSRC